MRIRLALILVLVSVCVTAQQPKPAPLQRVTVDLSKLPIEDIAAELARREAEATATAPMNQA